MVLLTTVSRSVRDVRMSRAILKDHPEICDEIEKQVRIQYHLLPEEENAAKEADKAAASAETEEE